MMMSTGYGIFPSSDDITSNHHSHVFNAKIMVSEIGTGRKDLIEYEYE